MTELELEVPDSGWNTLRLSLWERRGMLARASGSCDPLVVHTPRVHEVPGPPRVDPTAGMNERPAARWAVFAWTHPPMKSMLPLEQQARPMCGHSPQLALHCPTRMSGQGNIALHLPTAIAGALPRASIPCHSLPIIITSHPRGTMAGLLHCMVHTQGP